MIIKQAIFDLDGTLLETMNSLIKTGNTMLAQLGYSGIEVDKYKNFVGYGAKKLVEQLIVASGDEKAEQLDEAYDIYMKLFDEYCCYQVEPYPGILELIEGLQEKNISLGVLTNKPHQMTERVLATAFPEGTFAFIQGQDIHLPRKPDPIAAFYVAEKIGATDMSQVAFIGDSDADMQTAVNAGMIPVGVSWGFRTPAELIEHGSKLLLNHPLDLLAAISPE